MNFAVWRSYYRTDYSILSKKKELFYEKEEHSSIGRLDGEENDKQKFQGCYWTARVFVGRTYWFHWLFNNTVNRFFRIGSAGG
jgi:hypothetical protein